MKKNLLVLLVTLVSASAFAADYECTLNVEQNGVAVGTIKLAQEVGKSSGPLYTLPVSLKKNKRGKVTKSVEIQVAGEIYSGGESSGETGIDATLTLVTIENRSSIFSRSTENTKLQVAHIKGRGRVTVNETSLIGYTVRGSCEVNE